MITVDISNIDLLSVLSHYDGEVRFMGTHGTSQDLEGITQEDFDACKTTWINSGPYKAIAEDHLTSDQIRNKGPSDMGLHRVILYNKGQPLLYRYYLNFDENIAYSLADPFAQYSDLLIEIQAAHTNDSEGNPTKVTTTKRWQRKYIDELFDDPETPRTKYFTPTESKHAGIVRRRMIIDDMHGKGENTPQATNIHNLIHDFDSDISLYINTGDNNISTIVNGLTVGYEWLDTDTPTSGVTYRQFIINELYIA